jgi:hypothetical protein
MPDWLEQSDFEGNFPDFRILRRKVRPFQDAPLYLDLDGSLRE